MVFARRLEQLMAINGLNKHTFSLKTGIPYTTVKSWFDKDNDKVSLDTVIQISNMFHISLNYWTEENYLDLIEPDYFEYISYLKNASEETLELVRFALRMPNKNGYIDVNELEGNKNEKSN